MTPKLIPKIAIKSKIKSIYRSGIQTTDQLIIRGIVRQITYISQDIRHARFSRVAHPEDRQKAYENLRLLIFNNLPKHLIVTVVCLVVPVLWFPGSTGVSRYIIHSNPLLRKYMKLKFQERRKEENNSPTNPSQPESTS